MQIKLGKNLIKENFQDKISRSTVAFTTHSAENHPTFSSSLEAPGGSLEGRRQEEEEEEEEEDQSERGEKRTGTLQRQ